MNNKTSKQQFNYPLLTIDKNRNSLEEEYVIFSANPIKRPPNDNFRFDKYIIGKYKKHYYKFNTNTKKWYHINKNLVNKNLVLYRNLYYDDYK